MFLRLFFLMLLFFWQGAQILANPFIHIIQNEDKAHITLSDKAFTLEKDTEFLWNLNQEDGAFKCTFTETGLRVVTETPGNSKNKFVLNAQIPLWCDDGFFKLLKSVSGKSLCVNSKAPLCLPSTITMTENLCCMAQEIQACDVLVNAKNINLQAKECIRLRRTKVAATEVAQLNAEDTIVTVESSLKGSVLLSLIAERFEGYLIERGKTVYIGEVHWYRSRKRGRYPVCWRWNDMSDLSVNKYSSDNYILMLIRQSIKDQAPEFFAPKSLIVSQGAVTFEGFQIKIHGRTKNYQGGWGYDYHEVTQGPFFGGGMSKAQIQEKDLQAYMVASDLSQAEMQNIGFINKLQEIGKKPSIVLSETDSDEECLSCKSVSTADTLSTIDSPLEDTVCESKQLRQDITVFKMLKEISFLSTLENGHTIVARNIGLLAPSVPDSHLTLCPQKSLELVEGVFVSERFDQEVEEHTFKDVIRPYKETVVKGMGLPKNIKIQQGKDENGVLATIDIRKQENKFMLEYGAPIVHRKGKQMLVTAAGIGFSVLLNIATAGTASPFSFGLTGAMGTLASSASSAVLSNVFYQTANYLAFGQKFNFASLGQSVLTAGLTAGLSEYLPSGNAVDVFSKPMECLLTHTIQNGVGSVVDAGVSACFGEKLSLKNVTKNIGERVALATGANVIGKVFEPDTKNISKANEPNIIKDVLQSGTHAGLAGGAALLFKKDVSSAAGGAFIGEFVAKQLDPDLEKLAKQHSCEEKFMADVRKQANIGMNIAEATAKMTALLTRRDVDVAGNAAHNAIANNHFIGLFARAAAALSRIVTAKETVEHLMRLKDIAADFCEGRPVDTSDVIQTFVDLGLTVLPSPDATLKKSFNKLCKKVHDGINSGIKASAPRANSIYLKKKSEAGDGKWTHLVPEYMRGLKKALVAPTKKIRDKARQYIKSGHAKKLVGKELYKHRNKFRNKSFKDRLIKEWEKNTGKEWPRYPADYKNADGTPSKLAGQRYDAHHFIPQCLSGPHEEWNLFPVHRDDHQKIIHGSGAALTEIIKIITKATKQ